MIRILYILFTLIMISCSDYIEQEQILDYNEYLYQGWVAFETINIENKYPKDSTNSYYYDLATDMFDVSEIALNYEFESQNLEGPYYKTYNGLGWTKLYFASEFLNPEQHFIRDSLRIESKFYFDRANQSLNSQLDNNQILSQDKCDIFSGLSYAHYYNGLNYFDFDSSLFFSENLINECPLYTFEHDELDISNIHYLRAKIYLYQDSLSNACFEINAANNCSCDIDDVDINILLDCLEQFSNQE